MYPSAHHQPLCYVPHVPCTAFANQQPLSCVSSVDTRLVFLHPPFKVLEEIKTEEEVKRVCSGFGEANASDYGPTPQDSSNVYGPGAGLAAAAAGGGGGGAAAASSWATKSVAIPVAKAAALGTGDGGSGSGGGGGGGAPGGNAAQIVAQISAQVCVVRCGKLFLAEWGELITVEANERSTGPLFSWVWLLLFCWDPGWVFRRVFKAPAASVQ